jgi:hypothetical protein
MRRSQGGLASSVKEAFMRNAIFFLALAVGATVQLVDSLFSVTRSSVQPTSVGLAGPKTPSVHISYILQARGAWSSAEPAVAESEPSRVKPSFRLLEND